MKGPIACPGKIPPWLLMGALILMGILLVLPVWIVRYPPLLDYPNHLASGFVLAHLHDPRFNFSEFYAARWDVYPYVLQEALLVALQHLVSIDLAGRILLSMCLVAPPLAAWFFLRQANPTGELSALWALALSYNSFFLTGFLAYVLSIAAGFVALGFWLRYLEKPNPLRWIGLAILFTVAYATHPIAFLVLWIACTLLLLTRRRSLREHLLTWLLFVPGAVFYLHVARGAGVVPADVVFRTVKEKLEWSWGVFSVFRGINRPAYHGTWALLVISAVVARWRNPDFRWNLEWIIVSVALLCAFALLPLGYSLGHGYFAWDLDRRMLPFAFIVVLATARIGPRVRWVAALAILAFVLQTGGAGRHFIIHDQPRLARLAASFEAIPPHARVLPVVEYDAVDFLAPYQHFWAHGIVERGWLCPYLFSIPGVYPLRERDGVYAPEAYRFSDYGQGLDWERVRMNYDYIWAFNARRFSPQLLTMGERVFARDEIDVYSIDVYRLNRRAGSGR